MEIKEKNNKKVVKFFKDKIKKAKNKLVKCLKRKDQKRQ